MGNYQTTNINVEHLFVPPMPKPETLNYCIQVNLPFKANILNCKDNITSTEPTTKIFLSITNSSVCVLTEQQNNKDPDIIWTPKSYLRDFEVVNPLKSNEIKIARWAGIGDIVIEKAPINIKIFCVKSQDDPNLKLDVQSWDHSVKAKDILNQNLAIGYDVLYISGDDLKQHYLREKLDHRDSKKTIIYAPGLEKTLGHKRKSCDEDEDDDNDDDNKGKENK